MVFGTPPMPEVLGLAPGGCLQRLKGRGSNVQSQRGCGGGIVPMRYDPLSCKKRYCKSVLSANITLTVEGQLTIADACQEKIHLQAHDAVFATLLARQTYLSAYNRNGCLLCGRCACLTPGSLGVAATYLWNVLH